MSSMMQDLMAQAPPQGAPPPDQGGGNPMAALMAAAPGGADPTAGADPYGGAPPPDQGGGDQGEAGEAQGGDETTDYQDAISALQNALNRPTTDQQEMAEIQKCIAAIQGLLGKNEKMMDTALGTNPQLRKTLAGGGG